MGKAPADIPITWDMANAWIEEGTVDSLANLQRSTEGIQAYRAALAKIKATYSTTADYLYVTVFGAEAVPGPDGKLVATPITRPSMEEPADLIWRVNDFPYNFEEGVEHHILWSSRPLTFQEIKTAISEQFPDNPTTYWVNPTELQSVTAIWHAHVLVRQLVKD